MHAGLAVDIMAALQTGRSQPSPARRPLVDMGMNGLSEAKAERMKPGARGLAHENGRVLATLAVGAGAMTMSPVNDQYFWLVATSTGLSPLRGLATITAGTFLQGPPAVAVPLVLSVLASTI
jgi:GntP family permease